MLPKDTAYVKEVLKDMRKNKKEGPMLPFDLRHPRLWQQP